MIMVLAMLVSERLNQMDRFDPLCPFCALFVGICVHWTKGKEIIEIQQVQADVFQNRAVRIEYAKKHGVS